MARNLPIGFAAVLAGGVLLDAAIKGASVSSVVQGNATSASAGGASSSTGGLKVSGKGAVNPFAKAKGLVLGRTDQGVDANMAVGSPILAPFAGKVTAINQNWYSGQPQIVVEGTGAFKGKFLYLAEQIVPSVHVGQSIGAGQQLATYASHGTGIEMGWAHNAAGQTQAQATSGYTEGKATAAGNSFRTFLGSLGVKL